MTGVMLLGFLLGMRHATDADHVIAVATIVSRQRGRWSAMLIGSLWGLGHTTTVLVVGGLIILCDLVIPPRLGLAMEFAVALMLIALGVAGLTWRASALGPSAAGASRGGAPAGSCPPGAASSGSGAQAASCPAPAASSRDRVHAAPRAAGAVAHGSSARGVAVSRREHNLGGLGVDQMVRPVVVGLVHGLAGSAAVALLVLASIRDPLWGMLYLLLFGVGTVLGMAIVTSLIALPVAYSACRFAWLHRAIGLAAAALSLGVGLVLAYQVGLVDGLFTANPQWSPK
jgi:high-affinity nickel-transport protein